MKRYKTVEEYLKGSKWRNELNKLRQLLLSTELKEEVKWGAPHYTLGGKNLIGIAGFKKYFGLWFHQGVLLKDPKKILINAQEGKTQALRQWRFNNIQEIDDDLILSYIHEAIQNQKDGKEIKPTKKPFVTPELIKKTLDSNPAFKEMFESFNLTRKREVIEYVCSPKKEETRLKKLDQVIPMVIQGVSPNDKYRK
jgi:uncharacterized protein YdeI (YjbR/CyaY-like superfamily)